MFSLLKYLTQYKEQKIVQHRKQETLTAQIDKQFLNCPDAVYQFTLAMNGMMIREGIQTMRTDLWNIPSVCETNLKERDEILGKLELELQSPTTVCKQLPLITEHLNRQKLDLNPWDRY